MEFQRTQGVLLGFSINEVCEVLRVSGQAKQIGLQIKARILQVNTYVHVISLGWVLNIRGGPLSPNWTG